MGVVVQGLHEFEASGDEKGDRTYTVKFRSIASAPPTVISASAVTGAVVAFSGGDIGATWVEDFTAYCRSIRSRCIKRRDGPSPTWEWETVYEYSSRIEKDSPQGPTKEKDPTKRPPMISVKTVVFDAPATIDKNNDQITNSARDPVVRTQKKSRLMFHWSRYMKHWDYTNNIMAGRLFTTPLGLPNLDGNGFFNFQDTGGVMLSTNKGFWKPFGPYSDRLGQSPIAPGKARIEDIRCELFFESGGGVKVDIDVSHDSNAFADDFLDQGFTYNNTFQRPFVPPGVADGTAPLVNRRDFLSRHGGMSATPQLLDGCGNPLDENDKPQIRSYLYYFQRDWDAEPLGGPDGYFS